MRIPTTRFLTATLCLAALSILNSIPAQTGCVAPPPGLVGWWRAEANALDQTGVNDGLLEGPVSFAPAEVGKGFVFDGTNAYVKVPASPSLDVGSGPGFTVEGWIKPSDLRERPIVEWNSGLTTVPYGAHLWMSTVLPNGNGPGCLYANLVDTNDTSHTIASAGGLVSTDSFQHVALTFSRTNGSAVLYLNGASVAQATLGSFVPKTDADFYLGTRIAGGAQNHFWAGLMDEMTLYDRALSATEIRAIFNAGSAGKCVTAVAPSITSEPVSQTAPVGSNVTFEVTATGTPPLSYHWRMNTNNIVGATNATLTLSNVQPANAGSYSVIVSNLFGSATSSTAVLTVTTTGVAPLITKEPVSQTAAPGATVVFYVTATGAPPLSYRWLMNSNVIVAATNASLTLSNVQLANAGGYSVIVTNAFGRATSSSAVLTVTNPPALVQAAFASGIGSQPVTVPILLIANGNENALAFTLDFNPALLTYSNIVLGSGASNATLVFNAAQASNGFLGAGVALSAGAVFKAGTQEVADVTFTLAVVTNLTYSTVGFGRLGDPVSGGRHQRQPIARQLHGWVREDRPNALRGGRRAAAQRRQGRHGHRLGAGGPVCGRVGCGHQRQRVSARRLRPALHPGRWGHHDRGLGAGWALPGRPGSTYPRRRPHVPGSGHSPGSCGCQRARAPGRSRAINPGSCRSRMPFSSKAKRARSR